MIEISTAIFCAQRACFRKPLFFRRAHSQGPRILRGWVCCALLSGLTGGYLVHLPQAQAQPSLLEVWGEAQVTIHQGNTDAARQSAMRLARRSALARALDELLAEPWRVRFAKPLEETVLRRSERYIYSFRAESLDISAERTHFRAELRVRIQLARLKESLRALKLPLRRDPLRRTAARYVPAKALTSPNAQLFSEKLFSALVERYALLNYHLTPFQTLSLNEAAPLLQARSHAETLRQRLNALLDPDPAEALLLLRVAGTPAQLELWLIDRVTGEHLGLERVALPQEPASPALTDALLAALQEQIQPLTMRPLRNVKRTDMHRMQVLLRGLENLEHRDAFTARFFGREGRLPGFRLEQLSKRTFGFSGLYPGAWEPLAKSLRGFRVGMFRIDQADWEDERLVLHVRREEAPPNVELKQIPSAGLPEEQADLLEGFYLTLPRADAERAQYIEGEDNSWFSRGNALPLQTPVLGQLSNRADQDFYRITAPEPGGEVFITWHRIGRTRLSPVLRIYDAQRQEQLARKPVLWTRFRHRFPPGEDTLHLEISDAYGHIFSETGGYLHLNYLLVVHPQSPESPSR